MLQFIKFCFFAGLAAASNIGARYIFSIVGMNYQVAVVSAYTIGMVINFLLNRQYSFPKGARQIIQEARTFIVVALIGLLLTIVLATLFVFIMQKMSLGLQLNIIETVSHVASVGIVAIYSFFAHKYLTFRKGIREGIKNLIKK